MSKVTAQLCPGMYKQQVTFQINTLNVLINAVHIFPRPQLHDVPQIAEGDPTFLGNSCHHCHFDNNTAPGGFSRSGIDVEQVHRCLLK